MVGNGSKLEAVGSAALHDPEPRRPPVVQLFTTDFGIIINQCCMTIRRRIIVHSRKRILVLYEQTVGSENRSRDEFEDGLILLLHMKGARYARIMY